MFASTKYVEVDGGGVPLFDVGRRTALPDEISGLNWLVGQNIVKREYRDARNYR